MSNSCENRKIQPRLISPRAISITQPFYCSWHWLLYYLRFACSTKSSFDSTSTRIGYLLRISYNLYRMNYMPPAKDILGAQQGAKLQSGTVLMQISILHDLHNFPFRWNKHDIMQIPRHSLYIYEQKQCQEFFNAIRSVCRCLYLLDFFEVC